MCLFSFKKEKQESLVYLTLSQRKYYKILIFQDEVLGC